MGKSSKDKRDFYYRLAKEQGWRARSAFKLLQLNEQFGLLDNNLKRVVDLCAAPGSWSQVLSRTLFPSKEHHDDGKDQQGQKGKDSNNKEEGEEEIKIIAMDLQPMTPLPHVTCLQADITHPTTLPLLLAHLLPHKTADLVLSDGAPDVTGLHDLDSYIQAQLLLAALNLATCILRPGGGFVAKIFRGPDSEVIFAQLACLFDRVSCAKPRSSRGSSVEAFVVCEGYRPPIGFNPSLERPLVWNGKVAGEGKRGVDDEAGYVVPFVACGDLSSWDSDATYSLPEVKDEEGNLVKWVSKDPVQPPTAPPYKKALEMRRVLGNGGTWE